MFGPKCVAVFRSQPEAGPLVPSLRKPIAKDRPKRCQTLGIYGVTLDSYGPGQSCEPTAPKYAGGMPVLRMKALDPDLNLLLGFILESDRDEAALDRGPVA